MESSIISFILSLNMALLPGLPQPHTQAVYGDDDRKEIYEVTDPELQAASLLSLSLVDRSSLVYVPSEKVYKVLRKQSLKSYANVCEDSPFAEQQVLANCSGFIVGENQVVTANHCIPSQSACKDTLFVRGFYVDEVTGESPDTFPEEDVIECKSISASDRRVDFALLETTGSFKEHLLLSNNENLEEPDVELVLVGNPYGIPTKVSGNGKVQKVIRQSFFATVDAFSGNSGSAALNANTLEVEGILVSGNTDYRYSLEKNCREMVLYPENPVYYGEKLIKASLILPHLK